MNRKTRAAIFLAAGKQTRFKADHLKCMSEIGGMPILERSAEIWGSDYDLYLVISDRWDQDDITRAQTWGFQYAWARGDTIGDSVASGLRLCARQTDLSMGWGVDIIERPHQYDEIAVVSADTFFAAGTYPYSGEHDAVFDPQRRITLWYFRKPIPHPAEMMGVEDRVDYMMQTRMRVWLVDFGWENINTVEALENAKSRFTAS